MSKCGECGGGKGGAIKYSGGSAPRNAYAREGASFRASLYGFDGFAMPRNYAANPIGRYRVLYSKEPGPNHYMPIERYKHPKLKDSPKALVPFMPFIHESDTFHRMDRFDRAAQLSLHDSQTSERRPELPFIRPPYLADDEEIKRRYRMMWERRN